MKRYDNYKDSGIEWIGEIPKHWNRVRIKNLVKIKVTDGPHETPQWELEGIPFISAEAIKGNQIDLNYKRGNISIEQHIEYCKKSKVLKGDILFCKSGSTTGKSALVETDEEFGIWSPLAIIRADKNKINNKYLFQSVQSSLFRNQVETAWTFGTQPNIGMGALENLWISVPPIQEQTAIANYLGSKTTQIDNLIAKKEQFITLLQEERTTVINQAVTKGLDPNVKMKDSGIEWLGEIPEHWKIGSLKHFTDKITDGSHHSPPTLDVGKRYLSVKDIGNNTINFEDCKKISQNEFDALVKNGCQPIKNDILLTKDGTIGRATIVRDDNDFVVLSSLGIIRAKTDEINPHYLREFLVSDINIKQMLSLIQGSALTRITITIIKNLKVSIPSISEQNEIVEFLNTKISEIDTIILKAQQEIELLKEYKTALISEVVTGKVDVRDFVLN